jgi:solute:Na+ symporter, SSS family
MHLIDLLILVAYMVVMLGVGVYFLRKNKGADDYYVGGRQMGPWHVGLSVVATDVGGGFSIGLGGLGFTMGLSGSWLLFTGLIGAWMAAVLLIPRVYTWSDRWSLLTFPQLLGKKFDGRVAMLAGIISAIGYIGFTSSQILAGAKLASATFVDLDLMTALWIMGGIAIIYTVMGGIKAVIYTDTVQWILLMGGLILIGIPMAYSAVGGYDAIRAALPPEMLRLDNVGSITILNWAITIIPIWFVGMTLYQRIYACRNKEEAKKAWFIAGLFEWPTMAFMGVALGLLARVAADQGLLIGVTGAEGLDPEMGLPLLLRSILPVGLMGLMVAAYFSAIMSTADSCLMAASGNVLTDVFGKWLHEGKNDSSVLRTSQWLTLVIGIIALVLATTMQNVLELMLHSYAFMVSGLLVPVLALLFYKKSTPTAAFWSMLTGGTVTLTLIITQMELPFGLDPNFFGILSAILIFAAVNKVIYNKETT